MQAYLNGEWIGPSEARASGLTRDGLLAGQGLLELLRVRKGRIEFLDQHLRRLYRSARELGIPVPIGADAASEILDDCVLRNGAGEMLLRFSVANPETRPGVNDAGDASDFLITADRYVSLPHERLVGGLHLTVSRSPREFPPAPIRHKTLASHASNRERLESLPGGGDETLVLNGAGRVTGAATANLFMVAGSTLLTPSIEEGAFPGILREVVIGSAGDLGIPVEERAIDPDELLTVAEVFLSSSVIGLAAVARIDGRRLPDPSSRPLVPRLRIRYRELAAAPSART